MITAAEIRQKYVDFFIGKAHRHVPSAPLVPPDDPTLLFTTAGMVQFKAYYSGAVPLPFSRAVTVQKCLRAGGKGSDLENVGRTLRHHTFFEMLGNFSFGDYFKKEAIEWAWEFCTSPQWLGLPAERIWPTVFGKPDGRGGWIIDEAARDIWKALPGLVNPVTLLDEKENFWGPAGGTGACGACSEIKFFMGSPEELARYQALACEGAEGLAKIAHDIVEEGDLFLEIWNLVFPEFDHQPDGSRPQLKNRGIDTGAGLERMTTACQMISSGGKVWSPYETDLLEPIVQAVVAECGLPYPRLRDGGAAEAELIEKGHDPAEIRMAINACADHARTLTFSLAEGIVPSNEGRGYVIRRILRRAARFGRKLGIRQPFLWKLVEPVIGVMGGCYPEITESPNQIRKVIRSEEERFSRTLHLGGEMIEQMIAGRERGGIITGEEAYRLYDTYGFPLDLTEEIAEERGLTVDIAAYDKLLAEGRARARASWKGGEGADFAHQGQELQRGGLTCEFVGYTESRTEAKVIALLRGNDRVEHLEEGQTGVVVLTRTPFYGEGGGQVGDQGVLRSASGEAFKVEDTQKTDEGFVFHFGQASERIETGQTLTAEIDEARRMATMRHHSATHLLQGALKRLVGPHVTQSGSHVGPDYLRFDFTNPEPLGEEKLHAIEALVGEQVQRNLPITTEVLDLEAARATGAIAPFGEKYGARVRVVRMGDFSTEFCGGTHLRATGEVGAFIITSESSVAAGIRRIEAQTGNAAAKTISRERGILARLSRTLTLPPEQLNDRVASLQAEIKKLKRELEQARTKQITGEAAAFKTERIGPAEVCAGWIEGADLAMLRTTMDSIKSKSKGPMLIVLGSGGQEKATLIAGATDDLAPTVFAAGRVVGALGPVFDGKGGGKPSFAQAGGRDAARLKSMLQSGEVFERLQALLPE